ncbi:MAG: NUDIX hydrolase [Hyphomicrobiaceae bacterium]
MKLLPPSPGVSDRVEHLVLSTTKPHSWPLARRLAAEIHRHWEKRLLQNPSFFDGDVLVLRELHEADAGITGTMSLERFSAFLYWKDHPTTDPGIWDGYVTAIVHSGDGHVLLARHAAGTLNAGLWTFPGGFLDGHDIAPDGTVDVARAALRELGVETGLDPDALTRRPGYLVSRHARGCAFAVEFQAAADACELQARVQAGIAKRGKVELIDTMMIANMDTLAPLPMLPYGRQIACALFGTAT